MRIRFRKGAKSSTTSTRIDSSKQPPPYRLAAKITARIPGFDSTRAAQQTALRTVGFFGRRDRFLDGLHPSIPSQARADPIPKAAEQPDCTRPLVHEFSMKCAVLIMADIVEAVIALSQALHCFLAIKQRSRPGPRFAQGWRNQRPAPMQIVSLRPGVPVFGGGFCHVLLSAGLRAATGPATG